MCNIMHFVLLASGFLTFPGVCKWNFASKRVIHIKTFKLYNFLCNELLFLRMSIRYYCQFPFHEALFTAYLIDAEAAVPNFFSK